MREGKRGGEEIIARKGRWRRIERGRGATREKKGKGEKA